MRLSAGCLLLGWGGGMSGMSYPIIIPSIVQSRWTEALDKPCIMRWRSLAQMLSSMVVNGALHSAESPMVDDLRTLAYVAHIHMLALQPVREVEAV